MSYTVGLAILGIAVALLLVVSVLSAVTSRGYAFAPGRVQGVVGLMGSGKSLFVMARVIMPVARDLSRGKPIVGHTGRPLQRIITNFTIDLPYPDVEVIVLDGNRVWEHLVDLANEFGGHLDAIVVIDEAHLYVPSAKIKMGQLAAYICSMARKLNSELWWVTQNEMKVHKRLRDDTQLIWKVRRSATLAALVLGASKNFTARAYEPESMRGINATPVDQRRYRLTKPVMKAYNSFELIVPDADIDVSIEQRVKPTPLIPLPDLESDQPDAAHESEPEPDPTPQVRVYKLPS